MHTLSDIEQATGQAFPPLYRQLDAEDRLGFGGPHPEWFKVVFPALQAAPPVLLYAYDYEPIARERLHEAWSDLTAADHYNPLRADMQLLPFAETGAGDVYCFWTNAPGFAEPPVLLVWHDDDRADLLAANYQDFLFRKMVESVLDLEDSLLDDGALADNLQRWLGTHRAWLRADQVQALETWFGQTDAIADGALHEDQADALIRQVIGFARINERIPYVQA
ncbi:SMI1/KNR4 family protein [Stenotrophomonas rhizophila]|uniref:SMI1/KNR4 family protein n=1 Tax=Stenotrophomonas rhizophila TaxID=216778 RepID=UPI000456D828|nr:SMI1/KNR4 family protein [Stenotrophomonas rhizophila]AHY57727.1 hypothetical protein DX03_03275 [Stenotrophomonas rhizophila]